MDDKTARLYSETDDACALCGTRGEKKLTEHHIDGDTNNNKYDNLIILCYNCHQGYHQRQAITLDEINNRKRTLIQKTLTQYGINAMKISARNGSGVVTMLFLLYHLVELGYMQQEETQMTYQNIDVTVRFTITGDGVDLLTRWFK